jgi:hypothetical protein
MNPRPIPLVIDQRKYLLLFATLFILQLIWNFCHFSIKWYLNDYGCLLDEIQDDKLKKKIGKRLSGDARAMIAKFAKIKEPNSQKLLETCYTKE